MMKKKNTYDFHFEFPNRVFSERTNGEATKKVGKNPLLKKVFARWRGAKASSQKQENPYAAEYQAWRDRFLRERLHLGLCIVIIVSITFTITSLINGDSNHLMVKAASPLLWCSATNLSLLACLTLHKTQIGRRHPGLLFLAFSWSVTLTQQILATLGGYAGPSVESWTLMFLTQAILMPVRWRLHLVSQLVVVGYCAIVNSVLRLNLTDGNSIFEAQFAKFWLYIFWFCLICDVSIYLYERLHQTQFYTRRELETAYQKLGIAEAKYRSIFENAGEGIFQSSPDGRYITANPALARIYGYESPEEVTTNFTNIEHQLYVAPNRRAEFIQLMEKYGFVTEFESQIYRKDGSIVWISEKARAVRDETGKLLYYEGLIEDITERKQAQESLRIFFHAVSHDLRNPVIGCSMVLKNLLNQPGEKIAISRSILERMIESCDRQLALINSLLEAHASEVRGVVIHCEPLQLSKLVEVAIADLEPVIAKNQATLTNLVSADLPLINADPKQLWRVFENLIANALSHNPPLLSLTLDATVEAEMIRCTVADNGVGMSQETCDRLFDLYVRGSHARSSTGLGLGLYLCRQIITAHRGEIGVNSSPGAGATFWFTLPIREL